MPHIRYPWADTQAMSCPSWSLPAGPPGAHGTCAGYNAKGTCKTCYAMQGNYVFANVTLAQMRRLRAWKAQGMAFLEPHVKRLKARFFRVFDSGDFTFPADVEAWIQLVRLAPNTKFWVVTRSWRKDKFHEPMKRLAAEPNVCLRLSCDTGKDDLICMAVAKRIGATVAIVGDGESFQCPKQQDHRTKDEASCAAAGCRSCWDKNKFIQTFQLHGQNKPVDVLRFKAKREAVMA